MRWFLAVVFAILIGTILPDAARAQCAAGLITNCPPATNLQPDDVLLGWQSGQNPHTRKFPVGNIVINSSVPWIQASAYGVKADGITSNDQALGLALYACSQAGTKLLLPPGQILLTGAALSGNATRLLQNCSLEGAGIPAGAAQTGPSLGTMILLTSPTVVPFNLGQNWSLEGINFYWPNQTGAVFYPPLLAGDGVHTVGHAYVNNVIVVNAYDFVAQSNYNVSGSCPGTYASSSCPEAWGDVKFSNIDTFAAHDNFRWNATGDGMIMANMRVLPGAWLNMCGFSPSCNGWVGTAASTSRWIHVTAPVSPAGVNVNANANIVLVGLRYGILVDNGATMAESQINGTFDGVGTIVDTSAGGTWFGFGIQFSGVSTACETPSTTWGSPNTGNAPCFNMGSNGLSVLDVTDFHGAGSKGDFIATTGTSVVLTNSEFLAVGGANDGAEYYQVRINASGSPQIRVQNNRLAGSNGSAHVHGISTTGAGTPSVFVVQGNSFEFFNDEVNARFPASAIVSGNTSFSTNAAGGLVSFNQINTNAIVYYGNNWDSPPVPTIPAASCGTSPVVHTISGPNSGFVTTGSGTVNSCQIKMPIVLFNGCVFSASNAISIGAGSTGSPATWTLTFYQGASPNSNPSMNIFYSCPGQQ